MPLTKKEKTLYRHLVSDAWRITWRRKELWIFGFFAAFAWGGGAVNYVSDMVSRFSSGAPLGSSLAFVRIFWSELSSVNVSDRVSAIVTIAVVTLTIAVTILASIISIGAIMNAAAKYGPNKASDMRKDLLVGGRSFWRIFLITLACRAIAFVLIMLVWLGLAGYAFISSLFWTFYILLFAVACLASFFLWFISSVASAAVAVDDMSWTDALRHAGRLLAKHWLVSIETTAMLFLAAIAAAAAIVVATIILAVPFTALLFAAAMMKSAVFSSILMLLGGIIAVAIVAFAGSALAVFTQATWALLYARLGRYGVSAKLERLFSRFAVRH